MSHDVSADPKFLEIFAAWLRSLGEDVASLGQLAQADDREPVRRRIAASLNYLFKSLDLIPDGVDDIGFVDDCFVLRVAAAHACAEVPEAREGILGRLADDAAAVSEFLGADHARLEAYVRTLDHGAARGRTVDEIVGDDLARAAFLGEVATWATRYEAPSFARDPKTLVKLRAFLGAKLPA